MHVRNTVKHYLEIKGHQIDSFCKQFAWMLNVVYQDDEDDYVTHFGLKQEPPWDATLAESAAAAATGLPLRRREGSAGSEPVVVDEPSPRMAEPVEVPSLEELAPPFTAACGPATDVPAGPF
jgi:hypothetical protein